jgi:hypothetical protein
VGVRVHGQPNVAVAHELLGHRRSHICGGLRSRTELVTEGG